MMGTEIQLKLGDVSLDYSKNNMGNDYGFLFQDNDEKRRKSDAINYDYYANDPDADQQELADHEVAYVRTLARVLPRLNYWDTHSTMRKKNISPRSITLRIWHLTLKKRTRPR